ncbi:MAG: hypothetical protein DBY09_02780 [Selenomonadales bacterium]|jgi:sigma-E processing peptidase SpoIIGA|nr:sigma-E processing peptidase SpoIIGA [Clostridiales bacterium]PWL99754.1 MAG: hypothetical protein DBY09_02780 [Selenomonadales bacterium]
MQIHVYFEQVLFDNLLMDFSLLLCARVLSGRRQSLLRLLAAAAIGAIYACLMPVIGFLDFLPLKLALPCAMALCAFASKKQKGFWAAALSFIGGTLLSGGAAFGLSYLLNADMLAVPGGFFTSGSTARSIIFGLSATALSVSGLLALIKKRRRIISGEAELIVTIDNKTVRLHSFIDSGNCLKDALSGLPVAIAGRDCVKQLLNDDMNRLLDGQIPEALPGIHIIGYKSVGGEGVLYGIQPQQARIIRNGRAYSSQCILAISKNQSFCGEYEAIINPDMLKEAAS